MDLMAFSSRARKARFHNPPQRKFLKLVYISEIHNTSIIYFNHLWILKLVKQLLFFLEDKMETSSDSDLAAVIGFSVGFGVMVLIAAFCIITITNRRFYTRHQRENAHYVGSVVTKHTIFTNYRPTEQYTILCENHEEFKCLLVSKISTHFWSTKKGFFFLVI